jgi:hypothetical protein
MFRLPRVALCVFSRRGNPESFQNDPAGHFNLEDVASQMSLDDHYARGLFMEPHRTYKSKGFRYPSERGKTSRPGSKAMTSRVMFPMHHNRKREVMMMRAVDNDEASTF